MIQDKLMSLKCLSGTIIFTFVDLSSSNQTQRLLMNGILRICLTRFVYFKNMTMKTTRIQPRMILLLAGLLMTSVLWAQGDKANRPSPPATASGKVKDATITINYSSPSVKGREIFGALVPYGEVWRAGANEATVFETDKDIKVEGKTLPAGKYSLYAIPGEKEWTIIFNKQTGQWGVKRGGATSREEAQDALSVKVKPKKSSAPNEKLAYEVTDKGFTLRWENTEVPVLIRL